MLRKYELKKNFIRWSIVCTICSTPSFLLAYDSFDHGAMILGIALFICLYTLLNSTETYHQIVNKKPNLKKSLKFGYGLKLIQGIVSLILSIALSAGKTTLSPILSFPDFYAGLLSIAFLEVAFKMNLTKNMLEGDNYRTINATFYETLAITLTEGIILSLAILIICLFAWAILSIFNKLKPKNESKNA